MLSRNLFYTGLTRAKKLALIVGSSKAISIAVKQALAAGEIYEIEGAITSE